jgi:hypothetical protein
MLFSKWTALAVAGLLCLGLKPTPCKAWAWLLSLTPDSCPLAP